MPDTVSFSCALVTGASSGLGEEFAFQIAPRVGTLVLVARREPLLEQLADRIRAAFPRVAVAVFAVDLNRAAGRDELVATLAERGLLPDLLVNNAGLGDYGEFISSDWGKLQSMLGVNIEALTHLTHALVPEMIRRGGGAIVNQSSTAAWLYANYYGLAKVGINGLTQQLSRELGGMNIRINAIAPGPIDTEANRTTTPQEMVADIVKNIPLSRMGQPEDLVGMCLFLLSDEARWITGQIFNVDGGQIIRS